MSIREHYIGGKWTGGGSAVANINPSDVSDIVGEYEHGNVATAAGAIAAAKAAAPGWAAATPQQRFDVLDFIGTEILARKEELGELLSREEGKTKPNGIGEAVRAGMIFKFFAGETVRQTGDKVASVRPGIDVEVTREPIGVVGLITPWNFPIAIPAWKIAPALAYGNAVVFKPASLVPGCAWALTEIISRSGLPEGVFNLVMGGGSTVGEEIITHPDIAGVSFTGSVDTGSRIAQQCVARMAKVQLEMGGKSPLVVLDDADLDIAVSCAVDGAYFQQGQRCTASSRLVVTQGIHDRFVDAVVERIQGMRVGNALADDSDLGPVIDEQQIQKDLEYIDVGKSEGARLAWGGERLNRDQEGFYLQPALFTETANDMRINREEIFGPVASVIRVKDYDEAVEVANDTTFGLASGIATSSLKYASDFKAKSAAGMVMVNLPTAGVDYHVPFGGRKGSSYGSREQGRYAAEFYTAVKTSYTRP